MAAALFGLTGLAWATTAPWLEDMPGQKKSVFSERMEVPPQGFGAGIQISSLAGPLGMSFSYLHGSSVEQVGVSQLFDRRARIGIDHLHQVHAVSDGDLLVFPLYCGAGIWTIQNQRSDDALAQQPLTDHWGLRFPAVMSMHYGLYSMDVFAELAPVMQVRPFFRIGLDGSVGARLYWPPKK